MSYSIQIKDEFGNTVLDDQKFPIISLATVSYNFTNNSTGATYNIPGIIPGVSFYAFHDNFWTAAEIFYQPNALSFGVNTFTISHQPTNNPYVSPNYFFRTYVITIFNGA
jgi:hypothetical protein